MASFDFIVKAAGGYKATKRAGNRKFVGFGATREAAVSALATV